MIRTSVRLQYANGFLDLGMIKEAKEELNAISPEDRNDLDVLRMTNRLHLTAGNWLELEIFAKDLAERRPDDVYGWTNWAYALRELERNEEAKEIALEALTRHAKEAIIWYNLACYCALLGELKDGADHLKKALSLDSSFEEEAQNDPDLAALRDANLI